MSILIHTDEIDTIDGLEAIRDEWKRLVDASPGSTPFQHPEWIIPWCRHLGQGRPMALAMRFAGRLCGLAPLHIENGEIAFAGQGVSDYLGLILDSSVELLCTEAVFGHLAGRGGWSTCRLEELRPTSTLLSIVPSQGFRTERLPGEVCLCVNLPDTIDKFRETHGRIGNCGSQKLRRRLFARGLKIEAATGEKEASDALECLFRLHSRKWETAGQGGVLQGPRIRAFHEEVTDGFRKTGMLRLYTLIFEGRAAAALYGFASRGTLYAYLSGYDPALARISPGKLLLLAVAEDCIEKGIGALDFLRGSERYKYGWAPVESRNSTLIVINEQSTQNRI